MCLDSHIDIKIDKNGEGSGYKKFEVIRGKLFAYSANSRHDENGYPIPYSLRTWIKDTNEEKLKDDKGHLYQSGFHILLEKVSYHPRALPLYRVKFRDIVAIGKDCEESVVIAREMYIIGKVK